MNSYLLLYILTRLDYVTGFLDPFIVFLILYLLGNLIAFFVLLEEPTIYSYNDREKKIQEYEKIKNTVFSYCYPKTAIFMITILATISFLVPTKNEALVILAGGKTIDYVAKNDDIKAIPDKTAQIVVEYLDKTLKELQSQSK